MQDNNRNYRSRASSNRETPAQRKATTPENKRAYQREASPENKPQRTIIPNKPAEPHIKNRWFTAVVMVLTTIGICVFLSFFILDSAQDLFGLNQEDKVVEITISEGATNSEITRILAENDIITKPFAFNVYSSLRSDSEKSFRPGTYVFNKNLSYDQLIIALENELIKKEEVKITFIEGKTVEDFAIQLEESNVCSAADFLTYLDNPTEDFEFMDRFSKDQLKFRKLEGYIFPDTYVFYIGEKVDSVARKFLTNFEKKIDEDIEDKMSAAGLTLEQTITLASIVQKEASEYQTMRKVATVFRNRLEKDPQTYPKLESDVTIFYVDKFIKPHMTIKRQDMYDAYNTYVCEGLPVGPICNPGMDAINAVINPVDSNDYFFVTDTNGVYYYAETAENHYENIRTAKSQLDDDGKSGEIHGITVQ